MRVTLEVNGDQLVLDVPPTMTLLELLRERLGLTGTKPGCGEGECGACAVIVNGDVQSSCLVPVGTIDGARVTTIEGLARAGELHPIQRAFVEEGAVQCGYCTPGMVMTAKAILDRNPAPTELEVRRGLAGNLCRCTGYARIVAAVLRAADELGREAPHGR